MERIEGPSRLLARVRASKGLRAGGKVELGAGRVHGVCAGRAGEFHLIDLDRPADEVLEHHGEVPLPPYLGRPAEPLDAERYQTVYARRAGAVAAPTAGLHFDAAMLERLAAAGVESATLTLHVGSGTYQPIRADDPAGHRMHGEAVEVPEGLCAAVEAAKARGGRVIAVGTTCVRALESAARAGRLEPWSGTTRLFIRAPASSSGASTPCSPTSTSRAPPCSSSSPPSRAASGSSAPTGTRSRRGTGS